jgi:hypothetical protein
MAATARFLYVQQNPKTLDGPYIIHTRKPAGILLMEATGHKTAYFKFIKLFNDADVIELYYDKEDEKLTQIEAQAGQWYFSQVAQKLIIP